MFESLFQMLRRWEIDDEVKEMKYQMATLNDEHVALERLQRQCQDLIRLGVRNLWHGFLLCSVAAVFMMIDF